jgi:hypothetical protein
MFRKSAKSQGHGIDRGLCCVQGGRRSALEVVVLQGALAVASESDLAPVELEHQESALGEVC